MNVEQRARELLARCLDEWGHPCEAENIREGEDLESYESELRLISQLLCFGMDTADGRERAALTPPEGYVQIEIEDLRELCDSAWEWHVFCEWPAYTFEQKMRPVRTALKLISSLPEVKP